MPGFEDRPLSYFGVSWERAGSTWLFVHADGLGTAIIPVEVK